jgi:hypothetical protein
MGFNWWREAEPDDMSPQAIIDRVQAEWRAKQQRQQPGAQQATRSPGPGIGSWPVRSPHEAPARPLSVEEAHRLMQTHRQCRADQCPRKAAARQTLTDAGHMTPDPSRNY